MFLNLNRKKFLIAPINHQLLIVTFTGEELMRNFLNKTSLYHLPERIKQLSKDLPTKIAIRNEFGEEITYGQFYNAAGKVAEALKRTGYSGKSVAIMCKDPLQMAIGLFGAWYSHSAAIPLRKQ